MKKQLLFISMLVVSVLFSERMNAQQCLNTGYCTTVASEHQYPTTTFSTTSSNWQTVNSTMNADNYTLFSVTSGNTYEWSYCEAYGGVSTGWDAQLTLSDNTSGTNLCFSDNVCGTSGNAPYISWVATLTGTVKLLTTQANCMNNSGSPYNTLVWRMANGVVSTQILGVDIYHGDGTITWTQVVAAPKQFAWAKATEGINYVDPTYVTNMTNGLAAGIAIAGYHFAHPELNAASAEASYFLNVAQSYIKTCALPPVLDFETTGSLTGAQLTTWAAAWCNAVQTATGIVPIIYTSGSIASSLGSAVTPFPLWIANPATSSTSPPTNIVIWSTLAFKQYSWTGTCPGIPGSSGAVDLDVFNGDMTAFNTLMGCATGIADKNLSNNNFILYPNPANDNITIENLSLNNTQDELISVYNIQGQMILQQPMHEQKTEINVSNYASGIYIVKVKTEVGVEVKKFVKQ